MTASMRSVDPPIAPRRLPLAGGASIRFRQVPGGARKVLLTAETGRLVLLPEADFVALERSAADPASPARQKLAGFVRGAGPSPAAPHDAAGVWRHVVFLNGPAPGRDGGMAMTGETARSVVTCIVESPSPSPRIDLEG